MLSVISNSGLKKKKKNNPEFVHWLFQGFFVCLFVFRFSLKPLKLLAKDEFGVQFMPNLHQTKGSELQRNIWCCI